MKLLQSGVQMVRLIIRMAMAAAALATVGWATVGCAWPRVTAVAHLLVSTSRGGADGAGTTPTWALDDIVSSGVAVVAVIAYAAIVATAVVAVAARLSGSRRAARLASRGWAGPAWWRAAVLAACGLGVAVQGATAEAAIEHTEPRLAACAPSLDGLPYPDLPTAARPRSTASPAPPVDHRGQRSHEDVLATAAPIVVRPGDSLWSIAEDLAPPATSDAAIAAKVHRLYRLNRAVIGDDPDLIHPRTSLQPPGGTP
jgi:hypothetical protein